MITSLDNGTTNNSNKVKDVAHICVGYFATTALGVGMAVVTLAPEAFFLAAVSRTLILTSNIAMNNKLP